MSVGCQIVLCTEELSIPMVLEKADKIMYEEKKRRERQDEDYKKTAAQYLYSCVRTRFRKTAKSRMIRS